jgi:hypothetical protein
VEESPHPVKLDTHYLLKESTMMRQQFKISIFDESWGDHQLESVTPVVGALADLKALMAYTAQAFVDRAIRDDARNIVVTALPRHSYTDGFTVEFTNQDDDFNWAYVVVAEEVKKKSDA